MLFYWCKVPLFSWQKSNCYGRRSKKRKQKLGKNRVILKLSLAFVKTNKESKLEKSISRDNIQRRIDNEKLMIFLNPHLPHASDAANCLYKVPVCYLLRKANKTQNIKALRQDGKHSALCYLFQDLYGLSVVTCCGHGHTHQPAALDIPYSPLPL